MTTQAIESQVEEAIRELKNQFAHEVQSLQSQVQALQIELDSVQRSLAVRLSNRRPILPDPDKLSKPKAELESWLAIMTGKLEVDSDALGDTKAKFYYVYGRLDSELQNLLDAQLQKAVATQDFDHLELFRALQRVFADPLRKQRAVKKLRNLQQGDQSFSAFFATWEKLTYQADETTIPDEQRIAMLRYALNPSLQKRLDYREMDESLPTSYDNFIQLLHRLAGTTTSGAYVPSRQVSFQKETPHQREALAMELNTITVDDVLPIPGSATAPSSTMAQRAQWQVTGCCRRCGNKDHIVRNCPYNPYVLESA